MHTNLQRPRYTTADFSPAHHAECQLLVDATLTGEPVLAFFDHAQVLKHLSAYGDYLHDYPQNPIDGSHFANVTLLIPALDVQYFPASVYHDEMLEEFGRYVLDDGVTPLKAQAVDSLGLMAVYRENLSGLSGLAQTFPQAQVQVLPLILLDAIGRRAAELGGSRLHIHAAYHSFSFTVFNEGNFTYHRDIPCNNEEEFNYYLVHVLALSDQHASEIDVALSGHFYEDDAYVERLRKYVKRLQFVSYKELSAPLKIDLSYADHWRQS